MNMARPLSVDLTGQRFGRLVVSDRAPNQGQKVSWNCRCDCGTETVVQTFDLVFGRTRSCGCYRRERARDIRNGFQRNSFYKPRTHWPGV